MERMKEEERELFSVYYILDIYYSLNSIIDSIDLSLGHYSCNNVDIYKKQGKLSSDWKQVSRDQLFYLCIFWFVRNKEE